MEALCEYQTNSQVNYQHVKGDQISDVLTKHGASSKLVLPVIQQGALPQCLKNKSKRKLKEYLVLYQNAPITLKLIFTLDVPIQHVYVNCPLVQVQVGEKRKGGD